MTSAPANLLAARKLLLTYLNIDQDTVRAADLEPAEVGIVGDTAHQRQGNSYHLGLPEQASTGYAATESPRDNAGLCEYASALDVGEFEVTVGARSYNLRHFSAWIVGQCKANAADTRDIREVIWSPDGSTVRRWDRLGRRTTGDSSHRWHTHISFFRDSTKAGRDLTPLFRRYLTTIGLLEEPDMPLTNEDLAKVRRQVGKGIYDALYVAATGKDYNGLTYSGAGSVGSSIKANLRTLTVAPVLAALAERDDVDEQAIIAGILAGLTPEKIAAAIPAELAKDVADELVARLAG